MQKIKTEEDSRKEFQSDGQLSFIEQSEIDNHQTKKDEKQFSLTLLTPERGEISLPTRPVTQSKAVEEKGLLNAFKKKDSKEAEKHQKQEKSATLPSPKFSKLGQMVYCVYNANIITVFQYSKDAKAKKKRLFQQKGTFTMDAQIKFVRGNKKLMLIAFENQFIIMHLDGQNALKKQIRKQVNNIIGGCFEPEGEFILITNTSFTKYLISYDDVNVISSYKMDLRLGPVKFIQLLKDDNLGKYLLIVAEKKKVVTFNTESRYTKSQQQSIKQVTKKGEVLQTIELGFDYPFEDNIYEVSNIPEEGMFDLSKAFYLGKQTFLLSLFEQIIVVRKQFSKYIVVDNTAIASLNVNDDSKTGQLVLVDRQKVVYNDHEGINVYNLMYVPRSDKIKMQSVDNFAAIDESQLRLYDGVLLQSGDTNIQVLFYFDNRKISRPGKKNLTMDNSDQKQEERYKLRFSVYAIVQSEPIQRLIELLKLKRPQTQINQFRNHFNISPLQFYKSQWSVSEKSLNDIINNLLQISDQQFIESELDTVLKKQSNTLNFLIKIEEKQVTRLKKVIISKIENQDEQMQAGKKVEHAKIKEELVKIIKKLLESKMFLKKLRFQNQFQAYKLIDFIEINKLREMSLKEQIKLLSSKGYEKRLKQFLNQFKYLAIANFEDIFKFLMENKDQKQANQFLAKMGFMFPLANNPDKDQFQKQQDDDPCHLWEDFDIKNDADGQGPQTVESFITQLFPDQSMRSKILRSIMQQFIQTEWFKEGAFKKHCKLSIENEQLVVEFKQLKTIKVYNILFKYLFQNIKTQQIRQSILFSLHELGRLPQGFKVNMKIREKVYNLLIKNRLLSPSDIKLSDFLILSETEYFKYVIVQNAPQHILFEDIKSIYQETAQESGYDDLRLENVPRTPLSLKNDPANDQNQDYPLKSKGFFEQCFEKSMENILVQTDQLRFYLNEFITLGSKFQCQNQQLLQIIMEAINRKFRSCGDFEQILGVANLLFRIDLLDKNPENCSVFLQIFFFNGFWSNFSLDYSFAQISAQQSKEEVGSNKIILQAIQKYCKNQFSDVQFEILQLMNSSYDKLQFTKKKVNIRRPTDFFQFLLFMTNQIGYDQGLNITNLQYFLQQMLKNQRFQQINQLNVEMFNFVKDKDPRQFFQQLVLKHVRQMQQKDSRVEPIYQHVVNSLNLVTPITIRTKQQRAFLDLRKNIETLDYRILSRIPNIRNQLSKPALVFMMNIWKTGNIEIIAYENALKTRLLIQKIYQKYKQTTSYDINFRAKASSEIEFLQFQIQRGYQFIERSMLKEALCICKLLSNQDRLYFSDLVYSLTCQVARKLPTIDQPQNSQKQSIKLVEYTIHHHSIVDVLDHLEEIMESQQGGNQFRLINALNIINRLVEVTMDDRDIQYKDRVYYQLFFSLLPVKPIQAFYFLMKNHNLEIGKTIEQIVQNKSLKINKQEIPKHLALAIYIRSLGNVVQDFYPTYTFFQKKQGELSTDTVKRDINILASKLRLNKLQSIKGREGNKEVQHSEKVSQYLMHYYNLYMESLSLSGYVDLTSFKADDQLDIDRQRGQIAREEFILKQQLLQSKRKIQQLTKNLNSKPKPIPIPSAQGHFIKTQEPTSQIELPSKKLEKFQEVKRRKMNEIKKVQKEFIQHQTNSNADKIIQMFKQKKQQRLNNLAPKSRANSEKMQQIKNKPLQIPTRLQPYQRTQLYTAEKANDTAFQIRQRMLERPINQRIEQQLRKKNIVQKPQKPYTQHAISRNPSQRLDESMMSNMSEVKSQMNQNITRAYKQQSIQQSLTEIKKYLQAKEELEVLKYLQKFQLVYENLTLGKQFIKKMFETSKTFTTWLKVIQIIIKNYESYSKIYQIKALKLVAQSLKIDIKVQAKQLFDLGFFSHVVPESTEEKYNSSVFQYLRGNLSKLTNDSNVHSIAKGLFYGMGLIKKYEFMVYLIYLGARLQQYMNIPFTQKQEQSLVQKLKDVYCKLGVEMRDNSIKELFRSKMNGKGSQKIRDLIRLLEQGIERSAKLKNSPTSGEDQSLLKVLKTV